MRTHFVPDPTAAASHAIRLKAIWCVRYKVCHHTWFTCSTLFPGNAALFPTEMVLVGEAGGGAVVT